MSYLIKEIPFNERPRERLIEYGASSLSNHELLAIILRTGYKEKSALEVAKELIIKFNDLYLLQEATIEELKKINGIGQTKAVEILASIELGKRINVPITKKQIIKNPKDSYYYLKNIMENYTQENLVGIYLNVKAEVICLKTITIGTLNKTLIHPREIFKWALKYSAYAVIIAHNHPSGDAKPSSEDIDVTKEIISVGKQIGIEVVDHIIIGKNNYYSYVEKKITYI